MRKLSFSCQLFISMKAVSVLRIKAVGRFDWSGAEQSGSYSEHPKSRTAFNFLHYFRIEQSRGITKAVGFAGGYLA